MSENNTGSIGPGAVEIGDAADRAEMDRLGLDPAEFVAVDEEAQVEEAVVPRPRESGLLDLRPLAAQDSPDLVLAVCATDADRHAWVWTAYAPDPAVPIR